MKEEEEEEAEEARQQDFRDAENALRSDWDGCSFLGQIKKPKKRRRNKQGRRNAVCNGGCSIILRKYSVLLGLFGLSC
jgi:hypothetical protein